ncbi:MAG: hypothetical protein K1X35_08875 [Caulobacteraceae bacterium]|nr:hypothetical protein [Caulobacteraceae bacterium]
MRCSVLSLCVLVLSLGIAGPGARAAGDQRAQTAGTQCRTGERVAWTCEMGRKVLSVCLQANRQAAYRYGPLGKPELQIVSNGRDGRAHRNEVMTSGGGNQQHLRFTNGGYEYIVYSGITGPHFDPANLRSSGLVILRGEEQVASRECPRNGVLQRIPYGEIQFIRADDSNAYEDEF